MRLSNQMTSRRKNGLGTEEKTKKTNPDQASTQPGNGTQEESIESNFALLHKTRKPIFFVFVFDNESLREHDDLLRSY